MRRPLPPELIALGDRLEAAAAAALARRRVRRQQVLNALASMVVVVPLAVSLTSARITADPLPVTAQPTPRALDSSFAVDSVERPRLPSKDFLPRDLRGEHTRPSVEFLFLPSSLRPALR